MVEGTRIEPCTLADARACVPPTVHINWQNQPFCIKQVVDQRSFAATVDGAVAGALGLDPTSKIAQNTLFGAYPDARRRCMPPVPRPRRSWAKDQTWMS
ncbi:MAG: hypothetical protein AAGF11_43695 [Myxococcota bacterium]